MEGNENIAITAKSVSSKQIKAAIVEQDGMLDWWVKTVIFAFFPIFAAILISFLVTGTVVFARLIGDGELILCTFGISIASVFRHRNNFKGYYYSSLIVAIIQIVIFACIKANSKAVFSNVLWASVLCIISSVLIAWQGEKRVLEVSSNA